MNLQQLLKIKSEVDIFQQDLKEAIRLAKETSGRTMYDGTIYGVNDISGTNIKLDFPEFSTLSISCKYISVFPEPVTPIIKK